MEQQDLRSTGLPTSCH